MSKSFLKYWLPVLIYAALIFIASSIPGQAIPPIISISDTLLHVIEYLPLGFLIARAFKKTNANYSFWKLFILSVALGLLYAASDELHQLFVPGRYMSMSDYLSDGLGLILGSRVAL